jgi:hypothetical protein
MSLAAWIAIGAGIFAAWVLAALGLITVLRRLARRRDRMITAALEQPIDPWDYELRHLIDENTR